MRLAALRLSNWKCFYGDHSLVLDAKVYAIVARLRTDETRSNWCGKSSLTEAITFVLSGKHVFRTEDEFISLGEKRCSCSITFDDGSIVTRSRDRGKSTVLKYRVDGRELSGDEARFEILRRMGLTEQDFDATWCFEQRQIARFILSRPKDRMDMVSGWVGLGPLEQAEAVAKSRAAQLIGDLDDVVARIASAKRVEQDAVGDGTLDILLAKIVDAEDRTRTARASRDAARKAHVEANAVVRHFENADRYEQVKVHGMQLAEQERVLRGEAEAADVSAVAEDHRLAVATQAEARRQVNQRKTVARGQFDGRCPIAEVSCPARNQINQTRSVAQVALDRAESALADASEVEQTAAGEVARVTSAKLELRTVEAKLESARKVALELRESRKVVRGLCRPDLGSLAEVEVAAQEMVVVAERELATLRHRSETAERARIEHAKLVVTQEDLDVRLATVQEAMKIFGKNGAQRRVAESVLGHIEATANAMLRDSGIELSVEIRWSREGDGLATACEVCGWAFPSSTKVKECKRCREARGPKLVHSLDFVLSRRSGAAEDLAGIAIQLAASAWLRDARDSTWTTAILDEATAHLDVAHRRMFLTSAFRMLSHAGFDQAFVVAHSQHLADALPGRILIESDGSRSSVRVVA